MANTEEKCILLFYICMQIITCVWCEIDTNDKIRHCIMMQKQNFILHNYHIHLDDTGYDSTKFINDLSMKKKLRKFCPNFLHLTFYIYIIGLLIWGILRLISGDRFILILVISFLGVWLFAPLLFYLPWETKIWGTGLQREQWRKRWFSPDSDANEITSGVIFEEVDQV